MSEEFRDIISPIGSTPPVEGVEGAGTPSPPLPRARSRRSIPGKIVVVRQSAASHSEEHVLDVTVGGEEYTEIVLRVPPGAYHALEGKQAILHVEE